MEDENLIQVEQFCSYYEIEISFVHSLSAYGLIEIVSVEDGQYLAKENISNMERMIRLHYELGINLEGIEAISHLLRRINNLQEELNRLKESE